MTTSVNKVSENESMLGMDMFAEEKLKGGGGAIWFFRRLFTHLDSSIPHCTLHSVVPVGLQ